VRFPTSNAGNTLRSSSQQLRDFAARLEAVREEERTRVAREIHDELGQALTGLKLDLAWLRQKSVKSADAQRKFKEIMGQVDETIGRVRRIASELRPSLLDNLGLIAAIEWQLEDFQKHTGIRPQFVSNVETLDLSVEASTALFRVVQEALTNVMRHAKASRVKIALNYDSELVQIGISDNGIGLPRNRKSDFKSLGILGMKERIARVGGDLKFFSEPGKVTRLGITIPASLNHD
jgi:signal transduction histidine kinase